MTTVIDLSEMGSIDTRENLANAILAYYSPGFTLREVTREMFPLDALVFAEHQQPYTNIEDYRERRCHYDPETNEWLEHYVKEMSKNINILPPILLDITATGVALVDGVHRTSALLMFTNLPNVEAWVVR